MYNYYLIIWLAVLEINRVVTCCQTSKWQHYTWIQW